MRLGVAQLGGALLQRIDGLQAFHAHTLLFGLCLGALEEPQLLLAQRGLGLQGVVGGGHLGLLFQLFQLAAQLALDVFHAGEVFARVFQAVFRFAAALFVFGYTRRFFQEQAQLLGAAFNDAADGALANDGVGTRAQAGAQKDVLHVAPTHDLVVDVVAAGAVAGEHALDGNFSELVPLPTSAVVVVIEGEFYAGAAGRFAAGGAVEDDVLHRLATQLTGFALPQHPAHGVHDVGLAAAVGPDNANELPRQREVGGLGKGFEAREFDRLQAHGAGYTRKLRIIPLAPALKNANRGPAAALFSASFWPLSLTRQAQAAIKKIKFWQNLHTETPGPQTPHKAVGGSAGSPARHGSGCP